MYAIKIAKSTAPSHLSIFSLVKEKSHSIIILPTSMVISICVMSPILIGHMSPVVPRIKRILNTLLPITLPIAMPLLPFLAATTLVASSGIEVPPATMVRPITALDILND